jgi:hypothetical protein
MTDTKEPLMTRAQIIESVRAELGIPITVSTIEKAGMNGTGPQPVARYGKTLLYEKQPALDWARTLLSPIAA